MKAFLLNALFGITCFASALILWYSFVPMSSIEPLLRPLSAVPPIMAGWVLIFFIGLAITKHRTRESIKPPLRYELTRLPETMFREAYRILKKEPHKEQYNVFPFSNGWKIRDERVYSFDLQDLAPYKEFAKIPGFDVSAMNVSEHDAKRIFYALIDKIEADKKARTKLDPHEKYITGATIN